MSANIPRKEVPNFFLRNEVERARERAMAVDPKEYPQDLPCAVCRFRWMQHKGTLCPKVTGYFDEVLGIPIEPIFSDTTFIPDVAYLKQPDFDVV